MSHNPAYRSEIDGLRAIAVLSVVLYHFGMSGLGGGFVGVDIFFVISGFLIGGILWSEKQTTGTISYLRFYMRRLRRLAPAYVAMALVSFGLAFWIFLPFEFREFGKSLIAATVYLSNVLFYKQAGYFDTISDEKPLLHSWSLSVEEQFYLFLPLAFFVLGRFVRPLTWVLIACGIASFVACVWVTKTSNTAAFYLFPFRAWELLVGVLLAIYGATRRETWSHHAVFSWAGLALICASVVWVQGGRGFPGVQALAPVIGTALILYNGRHSNLVNKALSHKIPVFFGLISYSFYLWHWPILAFSKYYFGAYESFAVTAFWFCVSIVVATVSWRYIERPFRSHKAASWIKTYATAALASVVLLGLGGAAFITNGLPNRFDAQTRIHITASADFLQDWSRCGVETQGVFAGLELCKIGPDQPNPSLLIWGDSHIRSTHQALSQLADETGISAYVVWTAGCPPFFDVQKQESASTAQQDQACPVKNAALGANLRDNADIETVLLIGRWAYYANGAGVGIDAHNTIHFSGTAPQAEQFLQAMSATVNQLASYVPNIFILRQAPEIQSYDARIAARALAHGRAAVTNSIPRAIAEARMQLVDPVLSQLAQSPAVETLDPWGVFCDIDTCHATLEGLGLYFDNNHLTNSGGERLKPLLRRVFTHEGVQ